MNGLQQIPGGHFFWLQPFSVAFPLGRQRPQKELSLMCYGLCELCQPYRSASGLAAFAFWRIALQAFLSGLLE
jgi:hypothetical protein